MRHDAPLSVKLPARDDDKPGWGKVGVIAAVGFVIGVAWPKVVGVRLGPSAPGESAAAASASAAASAAAEPPAAEAAHAPAPVASAATAKPASSAPAEAASLSAKSDANAAPLVSAGKGSVLSCKTEDGETKKGKECGALAALDALVLPRLRRLGTCAAAQGQRGKLSVVVTADFAQRRLTHDIGKSSSVGNADGVAACVKAELSAVSLDKVAHDHPRYVIGYNAGFAPRSDDAPAPPASVTAAKEVEPSAPLPKAETAGEATVIWDVALVRDLPRTGQIVGRLPRGSKVKVGAAKEGWFAVKFGEGLSSEGWLYRGAVGR